MAIFYRKRGSKELYPEIVIGDRWIRWVYEHPTRQKIFSFLIFHRRLFSTLLGWYFNSSFSRRQIDKFISSLQLDVNEILEPINSFRCFNDFFARRLKPEARPVDMAADAIVSPADGRILVYPQLKGDEVVPVKGRPFTLNQLLRRDAYQFNGGAVAVIRLCPADYHRFHFPCSGLVISCELINGYYHSVNPIALAANIPIFVENKRVLTLIQNESIGTIAMVEIGAFGVGSIVQTYRGTAVNKFQEKGYFKYGGSTIVLIFSAKTICFSADLVENTQEGYETFIHAGERIATVCL